MSRELCIRGLILCSRVFVKTCGMGLMCAFTGLFSMVMYSFYKDVLASTQSVLLILFECLVMLFLCGNLVFNYFAAALTSPGYTSEFREELRNFHEEEFEGECSTCRLPKPHNVHHCSACNKCVINLDHHCPWINNCVGFYNMRYFLLFLLYTCLGCLAWTLFSTPVWFTETAIEHRPVRFLISAGLCFAIGIVLIFFNCWSWYLALTDQNFVQILKRRREQQEGILFPQKNIVWDRENLQSRFDQLFGTTNFFHAFLPSFRKITESPFDLHFENQKLVSDDDD